MNPIEHFYEFGTFCIDTQKRVLLREGEIVPLAPKAFDTLLLLVQHPGEVLEKNNLMEMLWPDSEVEEANLALYISTLRKALGESPSERKYIVTVPGKGYKFAGDVKRTHDPQSDVIVARYSKSTVLISDREQDQPHQQKQKGLLLKMASSTNRRKVTLISSALAVLVLAAIAFFLLSQRVKPAGAKIRSIAILPFVNASDSNAEYLSDGITESLINSLSQLSELKVIARTTSFRYKGKESDPQAIGRDLRVDAIVTGKVTQQEDMLIVQADLLRTADGSQIWGAKHSRKLSDIFVVQELVAKEIAEKLRLKLTGSERQELSKRYTENLSAYQNYLLGWTNLERRTHRDLLTAINFLEKAIDLAPNYALAYAALTEIYLTLSIRGYLEPAEGRRKAEHAARKALDLDPNLAEAHVAIAQLYVFFAPYDFAAGDLALRHALELSPSMVQAHQVLGASLLEQGRIDDGLKAWQTARELDPLSPLIARVEALIHLLKRDYPRALALLRQSYELGPSFIIWSEIDFYTENGKLDDAVAELDKARIERKDDPFLIHSAALVAVAQGKRAEALQIIKSLERISGASLHRAMSIAMIYAKLNEKDLALSWLERGFEAGAIVIFYKDEPVWDSIRSDPRFGNLLRRMGIPL